MIVLGIETSCDETAGAVVEHDRRAAGPPEGDGVRARVLSSVVASQNDLHEEFSGVVPEIASRAHVERIVPVIRSALEQSGRTLAAVDAIGVGHRPGLIGSLLVGLSAAKALAWALDKPLVGVDHVHAHLYAGLLDRAGVAPLFPALGLVVSGGHTAIYRCVSSVELERLGATIDDAAGEAFDKAAAILGLGHPGGPAIDREARRDAAGLGPSFPVSRLGRDSLDFSFSGLKTSLLYEARGVPGRAEPPPPLTPERVRTLAAGFERAVVAAIVLKLERALDAHGARSILTGGGVTANTLLREELLALGRRRGLPVILPPVRWCVDNAAMIAGLGGELLARGHADALDLEPVPTTRC